MSDQPTDEQKAASSPREERKSVPPHEDGQAHRNFDLRNLQENVLGYLEARGKLFMLETSDEIKEWIAGMTVGAMLLSTVGMVVLFVSVGAALLLDDLIGHDHWGFIIVGGVHMFFFMLIFIFNDFFKDRLKDGIDLLMSKPEPKKDR